MEFLALHDLNTSENLEFPYDSCDQFNLDDIYEAECIAEFRFEKRHILQLEEVLQIPALLKIVNFKFTLINMITDDG